MKIDFLKYKFRTGGILMKKTVLLLLFNPGGFRALQISSFIAPDNYTINLFDELCDFVSGIITVAKGFEPYNNIRQINCGLLLDEMKKGGRKWLFAILSTGQNLLLLTYNSEFEDFYTEHNTVLEIIKSILITSSTS